MFAYLLSYSFIYFLSSLAPDQDLSQQRNEIVGAVHPRNHACPDYHLLRMACAHRCRVAVDKFEIKACVSVWYINK